MSLITKLIAISFLLTEFAQGLGVAPVTLNLKPIGAGLVRRQVAAADASAPLSLSRALGFYTTVHIGSSDFNLLVSIQDADTWVFSDNVKCSTPQPASSQTPQPSQPPQFPQLPCKIGKKYSSSSGGFSQANDGSILDGLSTKGVVGTASVTVGGVSIPKQVIGLVNETFGWVDESISGALGLGTTYQSDMGFPANGSRLNYNPIFQNMIANKLIKAPIFSLALNNNGGSLAFGGLPKSVNVDSGSFASAALLGPEVYAVKGDGYAINGQSTPAQLNLLVDTSSLETLLPKAASDVFNNKIFGKATFRNQDGRYTVPCDAKIPGDAAIILGGKPFPFVAANLMTRNQAGCISLISAFNSSTDGVLGVNFLKSVVAVIDPNNRRIEFAKKN